jgi:hypothetical protein
MATLGRAVIDKNNCKEITDVVDAFVDLSAALGDPAPNPGPGPDGTAPTDYEIPWVPAGAGQAVKIIYGEATGAVSGATFTVDTISSFTAGYTHPTSTQEVNNLFGITASTNQSFLAIQFPGDLSWYAWTDMNTGGGGGGTYFADYGLQLTGGDTFSIDSNGYTGTSFELAGSLDDGTFTWDTVGGWLERADAWSGTDTQFLIHEDNEGPQWATAGELDVITEITGLTISGGNLVLTYKVATVFAMISVEPETATVTIPVTGCS